MKINENPRHTLIAALLLDRSDLFFQLNIYKKRDCERFSKSKC